MKVEVKEQIVAVAKVVKRRDRGTIEGVEMEGVKRIL